MLPPNLIIGFKGNHADIPSGFARETLLDGLYPKGTITTASVTGGASTHTHTSPAHTHALVHHAHSGSLSVTGTAGDNTNDTADAQIMMGNHNHTFSTSTTSGGTLSDAITYGAASNHPPYYEYIFIRAQQYSFIPTDGVVFSAAVARPDLTFHADAAGRFIKGAATGQNAGGVGGSYTNVHDITHNHTPVSHTHTGTSSSDSQSNKRSRTFGSPANALWPHSHTVSLDGEAQLVQDYAGSLTTLETVQPAYTTLNAYFNASEDPVLPRVGDIAMFLGDLEDMPVGWILCDGDNNTPDLSSRFVKINATPSASVQGGSNTHTHAAQSHSHASAGTHTHTGSVSAHVPVDRTLGNGVAPADPTQQHSISTITSVSATYSEGQTTADASDNQPPYRTAFYIQMKFMIGAGVAGLQQFMQ